MVEFEGIHDSSTAVRRWLTLNEARLPAHLQVRLARLTETGVSPVDLVVLFVEAVYANLEAFDDEARELASQAALVAETHGFSYLGQDQRASRIRRIMVGEKVAEDQVPERRKELQAPVEEEDA